MISTSCSVRAPGTSTVFASASDARPHFTRVVLADTRGTATGFEVESESGRDVRRELASTVVSRGWGLLELRPMRISLEEIFLHLTTEEAAATAAAPAEVIQ